MRVKVKPEAYFLDPGATLEIVREYMGGDELDRERVVEEVVEDARWDCDMELDPEEVREFLERLSESEVE